MEGRWTEKSLGKPPVVVEEESADKVTVVLAAAEESGSTLQVGPVGVGCVLVVAVEAETVPAVAAERGAAEALVWILGSWTGPVIQGHLGSLAAAGPDWEGPAAGRRETEQTGGLMFGNKVAGTVGALEVGLAVAPVTVGACGAADTVVLLEGVGQNLAAGGAALGKVSGHPAVLVGAGCRGFAAGSGEEPGLAARSRVPVPGGRSLLVPAVHKIPSVGHRACHPCFQVFVLAFPLDTAVDLEGHNPDQGNQALVVDL